ncbi:MAG: selenium metabolism-associated LysR family transcriptional regulator [Desulfohalobiaceae bacterium]
MKDISKLDLTKLQSFCRVYERSSFSRAAQELFLSQPTISAHVHSLELELQVQLLDRQGRRIMPTSAGRTFYAHAREIIQKLYAAQEAVWLLRDEVAGELNLGGSTIPGNHLLPSLMSDFRGQHPRVSMQLQLGDSQEIVQRIRQGELDLAVVGASSKASELEAASLLRDQLGLVGTEELLAACGDLDLESLMALPWLLREQGSGTRAAFEDALLSLGIGLSKLQIAAVVHSTKAMLECSAAGLGLAVTSRLAAEDYLSTGQLRWVQVPELRLQREFYALRHRRRACFPAAQRFWELLQERSRAWQKSWPG